jgi:hypothetical protein
MATAHAFSTASVIVILYGFKSRGSLAVSPRLMALGEATFSISMALNIIITLLIAGRLLVIMRRSQGFLPRPHVQQYANIVALVLESGAILSVAQVAFIVLWTLQLDTPLLALPLAQIYVGV